MQHRRRWKLWASVGKMLSPETIPTPVRGLDVCRRVRIVTEGFPDVTDGDFQDRVANEDTRPDTVEQLLFREEPSGFRDEMLQKRERLRGQRHDGAAAVELTAHLVQPEGPEVHE